MHTVLLIDTNYLESKVFENGINWKGIEAILVCEYTEINSLDKIIQIKPDIVIIGKVNIFRKDWLVKQIMESHAEIKIILLDIDGAQWQGGNSFYSTYCISREAVTTKFIQHLLRNPSESEKNNINYITRKYKVTARDEENLSEIHLGDGFFYLLRVVFAGGTTLPDLSTVQTILHEVWEDFLAGWFVEECESLCIVVRDNPSVSLLYSVKLFGDLIRSLYLAFQKLGIPVMPILFSDKIIQNEIYAEYRSLEILSEYLYFCPERIVLTASQVKAKKNFLEIEQINALIDKLQNCLFAGDTNLSSSYICTIYYKHIQPSMNFELLEHCRGKLKNIVEMVYCVQKKFALEDFKCDKFLSIDEERKYFCRKIIELCGEMGQIHHMNPKIIRAMQYVIQHFGEDISMEAIAETQGLSPSYFSRLFTECTGMRFVEYLNTVRIFQAQTLIGNGHRNIISIAGDVGYMDAKYFSRVFKRQTGMSPSAYVTQIDAQ